MKRRDFIAGIGASALPRVLRAQDRVRRVGVLMNLNADDAEAQPRLSAFEQALQQAGWTVGRNVQIDFRWGAGDPDLYRKGAAELVAVSPDVVVASNTSTVRAFQNATRDIPIVFASAVDPVGGGLVASLARPGGHVTGFSAFEFGMSSKWLELLKEVVPSVTRVAVLRDAATTGGTGQFAAIQAVAAAFAVEVAPIDLHRNEEIEQAINSFSRAPGGGLIVASGALAGVHRELIIKLAADRKLPAVYPFRFFVASGGLIAYGPDRMEPWRRTAGYVDRILRGEMPASLPVQAPVRYELAINLKTARTLGVTVPSSLLARADEVIE